MLVYVILKSHKHLFKKDASEMLLPILNVTLFLFDFILVARSRTMYKLTSRKANMSAAALFYFLPIWLRKKSLVEII